MDMEAPSDALLLQHIFSVTISRTEVALFETNKTLPSYIILSGIKSYQNTEEPV